MAASLKKTVRALNVSMDFLLKAFYNFSAQHYLMKRGYISWAKITNYYSSFFAINSLLRLQGRVISRIWKPPIGMKFYIFPFNFQKKTKFLLQINVDAAEENRDSAAELRPGEKISQPLRNTSGCSSAPSTARGATATGRSAGTA